MDRALADLDEADGEQAALGMSSADTSLAPGARDWFARTCAVCGRCPGRQNI